MICNRISAHYCGFINHKLRIAINATVTRLRLILHW